MWYLIISIPDLCTLTYFDDKIHLAKLGNNCIQNFILGGVSSDIWSGI